MVFFLPIAKTNDDDRQNIFILNGDTDAIGPPASSVHAYKGEARDQSTRRGQGWEVEQAAQAGGAGIRDRP